MEILFKKLIGIQILIIFFSILIFFLVKNGGYFQYLQNLLNEWDHFDVFPESTKLYIYFGYPLVLMISYYYMFKFNNIGRLCYIFTNLLGLLIMLDLGYEVISPLVRILSSLEHMTSGAIIILMYFTPLKEKFIKTISPTVSQ